MNASLTVYDPAIIDYINSDFEIKVLANDCLFTEGPLWHEGGFYLFSDIPANVIYSIGEDRPKKLFIANSGTEHPADPDLKPDQAGSNGLAFYHNELLICQHGSHAIAKWDGQRIEPFISSFNHKPFNSPNDLIVHPVGRIYFSVPPYGLKDGKPNSAKYQPLAGVYCWQEGKLKLICDRYQYPNGVCLSPDHKLLYICSNKPFEKYISVYETSNNTFLQIIAEENSDGIESDNQGHIYLCNKDGLIVLNASGKRMALLSLPTVPANLCWGGKDRRDLLLTAREKVYLIKELLKF